MMKTRGRGVGGVLALSSLVGFALCALVTPTWTDNVESAQVLAGHVVYPARTPMYEYHLSAYSLTVQAAAVLLRLGIPEWPLSVLFSGLQGALAFGALSMLTLAVSRSPAAALLMPVLFLRMREWTYGETDYIKILHGHRYPNLFPNDTGIYGVVGVFWLVLVLGLFGLRRVRAGAFLLGVMPAVHAGLALPALLGAAAGACLLGRERVKWWRAAWRPGLAGFGVFLVSAAIHIAGRDALPSATAPAAPAARVNEVAEAFLRSWEDHNFLLSEGEAWSFFEPEYYIGILGLGMLTVLRRRVPRPVRVVTAALLAIAATAVAYTLVLNAVPDLVPWRVRTLLITRWLNLCSTAFPVLGLGLLARLALRRRNAWAAAVLVAEGWGVVAGHVRSLTAASLPDAGTPGLGGFVFPVSLVAAALVLAVLDRSRLTLRLPRTAGPLLSSAGLVTAAIYLAQSHFAHVDADRLHGRDPWTTVMAAASGRPGFLLVSGPDWNMGRVQVRTRRPLLLDPTQLNMWLKIPGSAPRMADLVYRVYGVDMVHEVPHESLDEAWDQYSLDEWQQIRREFGVTDVLVHPGRELPLVKVFEGGRWLYAIPDDPVP